MANFYELHIEDSAIGNILLEGKFSYGLSNNYSMFVVGKVNEIQSDTPEYNGVLKVEFNPPIIDSDIVEILLESEVILKKNQIKDGKEVYHYNSAFFSKQIRDKMYYEKDMDVIEFILDNTNFK